MLALALWLPDEHVGVALAERVGAASGAERGRLISPGESRVRGLGGGAQCPALSASSAQNGHGAGPAVRAGGESREFGMDHEWFPAVPRGSRRNGLVVTDPDSGD